MKLSAEFIVKERIIHGFGRRLAQARQSRGLTQAQLADLVGVSRRIVVYYEKEDAQPPGALLVDLARALHVTTDELLGLKAPKAALAGKTAKLLKRVEAINQLPPTDQRAILRIIDGFLRGRAGQRAA